MALQRLEGRNPVVECLTRGRRRVHRIWMDRGARSDPRIARIEALAAEAGVRLERVDRRRLDQLADGRVHNGVVAEVAPITLWTTEALLDPVRLAGADPLLVLADGLQYEHNLGAVLRSALGFGVTGLVIPTRRGAGLTSVVARVSMGAIEEVSIAREGLFAALKAIKRAGVPIIGADAGGAPLGTVDLSGPLALIVGEEGRGMSSKLRERCDQIVSIPLAGSLESLNVSVATALLLYEKRRQDGWFTPKR
ncbi:MAG TPA: 23S rRNA (guanosine(2251)-2'-O)-methyltransferase RlmB [Deltaproteobacteria bacterium]|nr:23S rRNA (guanosine(2251)-2'-O)-methyltransferase RlmB [Deltaproteobacteria bacterium]